METRSIQKERWQNQLKPPRALRKESRSLSYPISYSLSDVRKELSDAFSSYKALIKPYKGSDLRDEWFEDLAAAKAAANNTTLAQELTQQRQREKQRQAFRSIKWSLKNSTTEVSKTINGVSHLRTSKDEVEAAIILDNDKKYRQTVDTLPMSTLLPDLGFLGNTPECSGILQGTYIPRTPIDPYSRALLAEF